MLGDIGAVRFGKHIARSVIQQCDRIGREIAWAVLRRGSRAFMPAGIEETNVLILMGADLFAEGGRSFGDEVLLLGLNSLIKKKQASANVMILQMYGGNAGNLECCGKSFQTVGFRRNWLSPSSYADIIAHLMLNSHFAVIGADVMDGAYGEIYTLQRLRFLELAIKKSRKAFITGFSYNGHGGKKIIEAFTRVHGKARICARDGISADRLLEFLPTVENVADLAFLVDSETYAIRKEIENIRSATNQAKSQGKIVIGINLCGWNIKDKPAFFQEFCDRLVELSGKFKLALVLLPHDTRPNPGLNDLETLQELERQLCGRIEMIGNPADIQSGIDAKQAVRYCDAILTGRMHLTIAALSQSVPAVSFGYQGKFEGLYRLFGFGEEFSVRYDDLGHCFSVLQSCILNRHGISGEISERLGYVISLAEKNFEI